MHQLKQRIAWSVCRYALSILILMFFTACSSEPQQQIQRYLLQDAEQSAEKSNTIKVKVKLADYLAQTQILVQQGNTLHQAHFHRWAEPLTVAISRVLQTQIDYQLNERDYITVANIFLEMEQFHGTESGQIALSGRFRFETMLKHKHNNQTRFNKSPWQHFDINLKQSKAGYSELVLTLKQGLMVLSQTIEDQLHASAQNDIKKIHQFK